MDCESFGGCESYLKETYATPFITKVDLINQDRWVCFPFIYPSWEFLWKLSTIFSLFKKNNHPGSAYGQHLQTVYMRSYSTSKHPLSLPLTHSFYTLVVTLVQGKMALCLLLHAAPKRQTQQSWSKKWDWNTVPCSMFHNLDKGKFSIWDPNNETYQLKLNTDIRRSNSAWHNHLLGSSKHVDHQWCIIVGLHKYLVVICSNDKSDQYCYCHQDKSS